MADGPGLHYWHCWGLREDGTRAWFAAVDSAQYADRERVEAPQAEALRLVGDAPTSFVDLSEAGVSVGVRVRADMRARVPGLWYYEVTEAGSPPAMVLMVFEGHGVPGDSLLRDGELGDPPVASGDQLAAVRWYPETGEVDQIYVAPSARRQGLATQLIAAASALSGSRGEPRLWGDGQRTDLGEAWVGAHDWSVQAAPRTHVAPPMTPPDAGA